MGIFILIFFDNTWVWWTYSSHEISYHYCSFAIHHQTNLFNWYLGIFITRVLFLESTILIAASIVLYVVIKEKGIIRSEGDQIIRSEGDPARPNLPPRFLNTLVLCIAATSVLYRLPLMINNIDYQVKESHGVAGSHYLASVLLEFLNFLFILLVPVLSFVFLRPATVEEVRYMSLWVWNRVRYCSGSRDSWARHHNEGEEDGDELVVSTEESPPV